MKIHKCPHCGAMSFIVTAHVTQDWVVDEYGNFLQCANGCVETVHYPNDEDVWCCNNCGFDAAGSAFLTDGSNTNSSCEEAPDVLTSYELIDISHALNDAAHSNEKLASDRTLAPKMQEFYAAEAEKFRNLSVKIRKIIKKEKK